VIHLLASQYHWTIEYILNLPFMWICKLLEASGIFETERKEEKFVKPTKILEEF